jgi:very-short-patch-repair endonuclease
MHIDGVVHRHDRARRAELETGPITGDHAGPYRVRGAWLVDEQVDPALTAMLEAGLRPGCVDAAAQLGLWVPVIEGTHAYMPRRGSGILEDLELVPTRYIHVPKGSVKHALPVHLHTPLVRSWPDLHPVPSVTMMLEQVVRCLPVAEAAMVLESALHERKVDRTALDRVLAPLPREKRRQLSRVRSDAGSGTETKVRWWLESRRVNLRSQVFITGVGYVDLLVGTNWVIECDSRQYHDNDPQYYKDRQRDLRLRSKGYLVTRLTWEQVFLDWEMTSRQLLVALHRREHRRRVA